jgi:hypothetical protein
MTELASFLFIRTRSSIKYFPKFITIANIIFLIYVNSYLYPFQLESLTVLEMFTAWLLLFFLARYEYEAVNHWNPFSDWTPTEINPRCGYHHVLLGHNYSIGFEFFTLSAPLRFRETFTARSRSVFDTLQ